MASDGSYLPEFFTHDRLEWYQDLSRDFPLWCGNWPKDLLWHPLAQEWSLDTLTNREFSEAGAEEPIVGVEFQGSPTQTTVLLPYLVLWMEAEAFDEPDGFGDYVRIPGVAPLVFGALFAALNYLSFRWEDDGNAVRLPYVGWSYLVELLPRIRRLVEKKQFLHRRKDYMAGDLTREELLQIWNDIGEELGLIPDDHQGTTSAVLDDERLKGLHEEGMDLVAKFREPAEPFDSQEVAKLLTAPSDDSDKFIILRDVLMNPSRERAKQILTSQLERHASELDLDYWVHRLRFPMLRREEIQELLDKPKKKTKLLARKFLAQRVGLSPATLANKGL